MKTVKIIHLTTAEFNNQIIQYLNFNKEYKLTIIYTQSMAAKKQLCYWYKLTEKTEAYQYL